MKITYYNGREFTGLVILGDRGYIYGTRSYQYLSRIAVRPAALLDCGPITLRLLGQARWR